MTWIDPGTSAIERGRYASIVSSLGLDPSTVTHMSFTPDGVEASVLPLDQHGFINGESVTIYIPVTD